MLYRNRLCLVGSQQDIYRLFCVMLDNSGYLDMPEDAPPASFESLLGQILEHTREDGDVNDTFLYTMVSRHRFGTAEEGTCRMQVVHHPCGLYTACFTYDSVNALQTHEWLDLHNRCGQPLIVAQRAAQDFTLDKGEVIITGGQVLDNWDNMCECWIWLMERYGYGLPPDEAVEHFRQLDDILTKEEYDLDIVSLLRSCRSNLEAISMNVSDQEALKTALAASLARQDPVRLSELHYALAESVLWETEHNARWFATLDAVLPLIDKAEDTL